MKKLFTYVMKVLCCRQLDCVVGHRIRERAREYAEKMEVSVLGLKESEDFSRVELQPLPRR
jgi:hypothetical protein